MPEQPNDERCPCDAVKALQKKVDGQDGTLTEIRISQAVMARDLRMLLWVGAVLAAAVIGALVKWLATGKGW